jgi:hypothetical protein
MRCTRRRRRLTPSRHTPAPTVAIDTGRLLSLGTGERGWGRYRNMQDAIWRASSGNKGLDAAPMLQFADRMASAVRANPCKFGLK